MPHGLLKRAGWDWEKLGFTWNQDNHSWRRDVGVSENESVTIDVRFDRDLDGIDVQIDRQPLDDYPSGDEKDAKQSLSMILDALEQKAQELGDQARVYREAANIVRQEEGL